MNTIGSAHKNSKLAGMQPHVDDSGNRSGIILELLNSVECDSQRSQRGRASESGVAVGLVNAYLKFCIKKGFIKVKRFPARRYSYLLTPKGFTEKSRLAILHLSNSLTFFRQARTDCAAVFAQAESLGWTRVVLVGISEVAEISMLCALERGTEVVGIIDAGFEGSHFMGVPLMTPAQAAQLTFDGAIVTTIKSAPKAFAEAAADFGIERVLAPSLLAIPLAVLKGAPAQ